MEPVAEWLDSVLWGYLERCCGFPIPVNREQGGLVPVNGLDGRTFQEWAVRLSSGCNDGGSEAPRRWQGWHTSRAQNWEILKGPFLAYLSEN